jgi:endonuclease/exonuclease/phosphatase family metal-dependent hydrolase
MKKIAGFIFRLATILIVLIVIYLGGIILFGTINDYKPDDVTDLKIAGNGSEEEISDSVCTFLSWNIGYGGLGAEMDFFYDGGEMVHPTDALVKKYTTGILNFLTSSDSIDFILLQEVDKNSARTGGQNEIERIKNTLNTYSFSFGLNYKVFFVPLPFTNPLGKVEMGQMNLSGYKSMDSKRYSFFSAYAWPKRLFMLDRCFVVSRFRLKNGKELVVMNTHNSAYDAGGKLREEEMPVIRDLMVEEFEKGNYVVAGGDWNQNPPAYQLSEVNTEFIPSSTEQLDFSIFPEKWQVAYDPYLPTNRSLDFPLTTGKTEVTIIDYYIVSPNIKIEAIKVIPQNFEFSDHEAVFLKMKLN